MSFELSVGSEEKKKNKRQNKNDRKKPKPRKHNPNKPTATKIKLPLHMGLNPNCKAEFCKLCETGWNPNANPSLISGSGAPRQTYRSMLVKERLVKPEGSDEPPEGRVHKLE